MKVNYFILIIFSITILACGGNTAQNNNTSADQVTEPAPVKSGITGYRDLGSEDFKKAVMEAKDPVIIDVRTPDEIANGKLNGAIELNYYDSTFGNTILEMDKSKPYFIYCASGIRSAKTCRMMVEKGFTDVTNLKGGYSTYKE